MVIMSISVGSIPPNIFSSDLHLDVDHDPDHHIELDLDLDIDLELYVDNDIDPLAPSKPRHNLYSILNPKLT